MNYVYFASVWDACTIEVPKEPTRFKAFSKMYRKKLIRDSSIYCIEARAGIKS